MCMRGTLINKTINGVHYKESKQADRNSLVLLTKSF